MPTFDRRTVGLYVSATIAVGFVDFYVRRDPTYVVTHFIPGVLDGTYEAPFIYRPLAPLLVEALRRVTGLRPMVAFAAFELAFILGSLLAFHAYLRLWYSDRACLAGTLGMVALLPLTFTNSWAHPDSFPELLLFTAGCAAVARARRPAFLAVVALATLNRETSIFLVLFWILARAGRRWRAGDGLTAGGALALVAGISVVIRAARGLASYQHWMLAGNLALMNPFTPGVDLRLRAFSYFWVLLAGVPFWLALEGLRHPESPPLFRCAVWVAAAVLLTAFGFAVIAEPRVLLPLFPLLAPAALAAFADPGRAPTGTAQVGAA